MAVPRTEARSFVALVLAEVDQAGTEAEMGEEGGEEFRESNSNLYIKEGNKYGKEGRYLVRAVETQQTINASESIIDDRASVKTTFLLNDIEKLLESTFEREDFLDIRALIDQRLNHCYCL